MGTRIILLGEYYQKRHPKDFMYNIQICPREDIFTKGKFSSLFFTLNFNFPLKYYLTILH